MKTYVLTYRTSYPPTKELEEYLKTRDNSWDLVEHDDVKTIRTDNIQSAVTEAMKTVAECERMSSIAHVELVDVHLQTETERQEEIRRMTEPSKVYGRDSFFH